MGLPRGEKICTSHIEKQNRTLRMRCRRLTRLTNAFSKKMENFEAAVALNYAWSDSDGNLTAVFGVPHATIVSAAKKGKA